MYIWLYDCFFVGVIIIRRRYNEKWIKLAFNSTVFLWFDSFYYFTCRQHGALPMSRKERSRKIFWVDPICLLNSEQFIGGGQSYRKTFYTCSRKALSLMAQTSTNELLITDSIHSIQYSINNSLSRLVHTVKNRMQKIKRQLQS